MRFFISSENDSAPKIPILRSGSFTCISSITSMMRSEYETTLPRTRVWKSRASVICRCVLPEPVGTTNSPAACAPW